MKLEHTVKYIAIVYIRYVLIYIYIVLFAAMEVILIAYFSIITFMSYVIIAASFANIMRYLKQEFGTQIG